MYLSFVGHADHLDGNLKESGGLNEDTAAREVAREQEFVDGVYRQLVRSAASAQALAQEGHSRGRLGHEGGLVERDAMVQAARRLATLDSEHEGWSSAGSTGPRDRRAPRYVGRLGLRDDEAHSLVIDWRAPAAAPFYRATCARTDGRDPPPHDTRPPVSA